MGLRGFTLVELLMVLVIFGILLSIAIPSFSRITANSRVRTAATDIYISFNAARSEAVKRNAPVTISPVGGDWASGWQLRDAANNPIANQGPISGVKVNTGAPASIVFLPTGRIRGNAAPALELESVIISSIQRCVSADLTGRPYVKEAACS